MRRAVFTVLLIVAAASLSAQSLLINEIQVANIDRFIDPSYNYGGWIELYNNGTDAISLNGYYIRHTDSEDKMEQYILKTAHGSVPAHGYTVLWFDHNSKDGNYGTNAKWQIPFKLDADGGVIELLDTNAVVVNAVEYPACVARCSWMRETDGASRFGWTNVPSPNATNLDSCMANERLAAPVVSTTGRVFSSLYKFKVDIPEHCTLYYTTDGSTPLAATSPTSDDGIFQGYKSTIYRFMLAREGYLNSPVVTRSFFKSEGKYSLPILSVSTAPEHFFDPTIGLYVTGSNGRVANNSKVKANQNMDWERPVNVEYFVSSDHKNYEEAVNQEANFSIFGGWTRFNPGNDDFEYMASFKLKSDKVFEGRNTFAYPLFSSKPYIKIKNFLVRNGGQDKNARIWDAAIHELLRTSGVYIDCQAWQPTHVYLNGRYLGMMNLREESNKQFAFSNYGIDKDEIDQWEGDITIKAGDKAKLDEWYNLSKQLTGAPTDTAVWKQIADLVDIDEYCNYMAAEIYMGNLDWLRGGFKNLKGFRAKDEGGKFHIVLHDVDGAFGDTDMIQQVLSKGTGSLPVRFKNMLKYEPFKKQFVDAYCIMNGSVFDPERCAPIITSMMNTINPALELEGLSADEKATLLIERLSDNEVRRPALKNSLTTAFALKNEYTISLTSSTTEARLLLGGQEIPTGKFSGYLFAPITLTSSAPEGYTFEGWNINGRMASTNATLRLSDEYEPDDYTVEAVYRKIDTHTAPVRINEVSAANDIHINEYGKKADWMELYNTTPDDYDLKGAYLSDDPSDPHKYRISAPKGVSTIIPAHGYRVVWCDGKESNTQLHASFKLKNSDEAYISITDAEDAWTDSLRYKAQPRWNTYGRFPDGGSQLALFERPTIDNSNRILTTTFLEKSDDIADPTPTPVPQYTDMEIAAIRYYNLSGQEVSHFNDGQIVIQQIVYKDGHVKTSKKTFHK